MSFSSRAVRISRLLIAISVLAFSAVNAGAASAHSLTLKLAGTAALTPSNAYVEVGLSGVGSGECLFGTYKGSLTTNSASTDVIKNSGLSVEINPDGPCTGATISGNITEAKVKSNGKITITWSPALDVQEGECTYETSKLSAKFTVPSSAAFSPLSVKMKRSKHSAAECPKTRTFEGGTAIGGWVDSAPQDYELEA